MGIVSGMRFVRINRREMETKQIKNNKCKITNEKHRRQMEAVSVCGVFWNIILKYVQQRLVRSVHQ